VLKGKHLSYIEDIRSYVKKTFTGIPVQHFKNCFEQLLKGWEHCKELEEITWKNSRLLISAAHKIIF
jgi:hypothetical protein